MNRKEFNQDIFKKYKNLNGIKQNKVLFTVLIIMFIINLNFGIYYATGVNLINTGVKLVLNSVGIYTEEVKSVELDSDGYKDKVGGSYHIKKSAEWTSQDTAQIEIKLDTILKNDEDITRDIVFVIDTSDSMEGSKLNVVKNELSNVIDYLITSNKNNRIALITFGTKSKINSYLTNKKEDLISEVEKLETTGRTNYNAALKNVDEVLKDYKYDANRELITIFLTDGYANEEEPNQSSTSEILREKYPFMKTYGIAYEMGNVSNEDLTEITDEVHNVMTTNGDKYLYKVLTGIIIKPEYYELFELTDIIANEYWNVKDASVINTDKGSIDLIEEDGIQKVKWTFKDNELRTGDYATMTIDITLKDDQIKDRFDNIDKIKYYPANTKTSVKYVFPGKTENKKTFSETPVLQSRYEVKYNVNSPEGCNPKTEESTTYQIAFENVFKSQESLVCEGYQFKGWEIEQDGIKRVNDDVFVMPSRNITIRGLWSKPSIVKTMSGTMHVKTTLYRQVLKENPNNVYEGDRDYSYMGTQQISYYTTNNNHVIFAGFCWQIVRTTSTGGVKLLYNGEPTSDGKCTTATYGGDNGRPAHIGYGNRTTLNLNSNYKYGTDYTYDSTAKQFTLSGDIESEKWSNTTQESLIGKYTCKNTTEQCSTLYLVDSYYSTIEAYAYPINNTTNYSAIGTSSFNSNIKSPASVGYMYNKTYDFNKSKSLTTSKTILNYSNLSTYYYYGEDIEYNPDTKKYKIPNATKPETVLDNPDLVGKYTFNSSTKDDEKGSVYYIVGVSGSTMYYLTLTDGQNVDEVNDAIKYKFADSVIEDKNGNTILNPEKTEEITRKVWAKDYAKYKNKFYQDTDGSIYYLCSTQSINNMRYVNIADNYMYGNSFTYENGEYTLTDTIQFYDWVNNYSNLNNAHYTCWNPEGKCKKISYIYNVSIGHTPYYIELENGTSIEKALDEMLYNNDVNAKDSQIKSQVDLWYSKNLIKYEDYLEDTVWCNDRSMSNKNTNGWNPNGGLLDTYLYFNAYSSSTNLTCNNKNDRFTTSSSIGNGKLKYPVGLLTISEQRLTDSQKNGRRAIISGAYYGSLSPYNFNDGYAYGQVNYYIDGVYIYHVDSNGYGGGSSVSNTIAVRPAVSLKAGIEYIRGDGSMDKPYIVE